jgi:DTW domain-containing protein YfiP
MCPGLRTLTCPLEVDVLMHHREHFRPSSTGNLIQRVLPGSRNHLWRRERRLEAADVRVAGRELWIIHPAGGPLPAGVAPEHVQVVLLDGSWREASAIAREVGAWGRSVSLPMTGESRYWLRAQQDGGRFSTVEALLFLLRSFGLEQARAELEIQFELHVYAGLRARGSKEAALEFLKNSPLPTALPELLAQMDVRRPR